MSIIGKKNIRVELVRDVDRTEKKYLIQIGGMRY